MNNIVFVELDVHKATIAVAVAEGVRGGEVRELGNFLNRPDHIVKLVERLAKGGRSLSFCYEAGPCGYGLYRQLKARDAGRRSGARDFRDLASAKARQNVIAGLLIVVDARTHVFAGQMLRAVTVQKIHRSLGLTLGHSVRLRILASATARDGLRWTVARTVQ